MLEFKYIFGENGYKIAKDMRNGIFAEEMGFLKSCDELDENSYHFVGYDGIKQISVARLTELDEKSFSISYVGVDKEYRRQFVGDLIMRALADKAVALGATKIYISAPISVKGFFEYEGYESVGSEYSENGTDFVKMVKDLTKVESGCRGCGK